MLGNPHMEIVGWDLRRVVHSVSVDIMEVSLEPNSFPSLDPLTENPP